MIGTVYRIQDKDGIGPYVAINSVGQANMYTSHLIDESGHPAPINDKNLKRGMHDNEQCGFISMQQLFDWFSAEDFIILGNIGYGVVELDSVEITAIGEKQVLFKRVTNE